jgi:hypothetical protein
VTFKDLQRLVGSEASGSGGRPEMQKLLCRLRRQDKYTCTHLGIMSKNHKDNLNRRIFSTSISAAVLVGSFIIGSQLVQPSMAQDYGEQAKEKIGGAVQGLTGGNQTGNQTGNQSGGVLGQLGEKAKSILPGQ